MNPKTEKEIKVIMERNPNLSHITKKANKFERVVTSDKITNGFISPTYAKPTYNKLSGVIGQLEGFYCGNPLEWIPILMKDGYIPYVLENIRICELEFDEGLLYFKQDRNPFGNHKFLKNETMVNETFIVCDKPIKVKSIKKLTKDEMWQLGIDSHALNERSELLLSFYDKELFAERLN